MNFVQTIIQYLSIVSQFTSSSRDYLLIDGSSLSINIVGEKLVSIEDGQIVLIGKEKLNNKFVDPIVSSPTLFIDLAKFSKFISEIVPTRLNHVGISYGCQNIEKEIEHYKYLLEGTSLNLYEEKSDNNFQKWLFIGKKDEWECPLFEIVLSQSNSDKVTDWSPHFQIDVDTKISFDELHVLTKRYLSENFISWKLDISNYGVVLAMGKLADIGGNKIFLGIGTDLRRTEFHRKELLVEI